MKPAEIVDRACLKVFALEQEVVNRASVSLGTDLTNTREMQTFLGKGCQRSWDNVIEQVSEAGRCLLCCYSECSAMVVTQTIRQVRQFSPM